MHAKLRQPARLDAFAAGQVTDDLEEFGSRALDAVGVRLAQIFLVTVLLGVPMAAAPHHLGRALITGAGPALCAAGVAYVLPRRRGPAWLAALIVLTGLTVALLAGAKADFGPERTHDLAAWVVAGMASGIAASRGPRWGLAVLVTGVAAELLVEQADGGVTFAPVLLGALTYYVGGAVTHVLARRGFATTEQALEAVARAEAAQQVAGERWRARREADRLLHDTVLATLSVLAHQGEGATPAELRAACRRDLDVVLGRDRQEARRQAVTSPGPDTGPGTGAAAVVEEARREAARRGLELRAHAAALEQPGLRLDPAVAVSLRLALAEVVANVRHARVRHLDLMASVTEDALVLVVLDEGQGFELARVPADRLGLRASVQERLAAVGGGAAIWTQPGQGTSVMLRVPLPGRAVVTASVLLDVPTRRRAFPQIFNRLVLILAVQAHLYALVVIVQSRASYRSLPACLAIWAVSLAVPMACLVVARRAGGALPAVPFLAASVLLVAIDLGLTVVVRPPDRGGGAMWTWGVIGVTILGFAAFRPARDVLLVAAGHGLTAIGVTVTAPDPPGGTAFAVLVAVNAAVTPALAAAGYLNLYIRAVRLREQAAAERRRIQTRHAAEQAIEEDAAGRLRSLQAEAVPLLAGVADGTLATDDPQVARLARRLGADLRRELVAARSSQWLLSASWTGADPGPSVDVLDPHRLLGRLHDTDRAALAALLSVLRDLADWQRLSVALEPGSVTLQPGSVALEPRSVARPPASTAVVTVVATGPDAATAARDAAVAAAARQFRARLGLEANEVLVAEAGLVPVTPVRPAERDAG